MKFLVLSHVQPDATEADMAPHLADEAATAWDLYVDGFIREAYFRTAPAAPGAALMVEADSVREAQQRVDTLPLRRAGLVRFEVIPLGPFLPWAALVSAGSAQTGAVAGR